MDLPLFLIGCSAFLLIIAIGGAIADRHERQARREEPPYVKVPSYWGKPR